MSLHRSPAALDPLRRQVRLIELADCAIGRVLPFGVGAIDERLPGHGLAMGALHEVAGGAEGALHGAAAASFAAGILARADGPVLWCLRQRDLFAPALAQAGLPPKRVIFAEAGDEAAILGAMEEGLKYHGLAGVVGEVAKLSMTASRRLQLAAERSGQMAIAIRRWRRIADAADLGQPAAAVTRWRVSPSPPPLFQPPAWGVPVGFLNSCVAAPVKLSTSRLKPVTPRVISVFLPQWPTDRLRRSLGKSAPPPDVPVVMVGRVGRRRAVASLNTAAAEAGVRLGQAIAHASAMVPGLVLHDLDTDGDAAALHRLALWAQRLYSPVAAPDPFDGLVIDATGAAHLRGGEEKMLIDIRSRLEKVGLQSQVAIADTWGAAHALARYSRRAIYVADPGVIGRVISDLPVAALRLPASTVEALGRLGFDTIGELEATPKGPLAHRIGYAPVRRLDQAFGRHAEPIEPVMAPETLTARRAFAEPIGAPETMARYVTQLVGELCAALEAVSLGARSLNAYFVRVDNRTETARIAMASPTRDAKRLARLLCEKLENVDPGFGVEKIILAAPGAESLVFKQTESLGVSDASTDLSALVDTLTNRLGAGQVYRLASAESDLPERSVRAAPALETVEEFSWPLDWPRPARLFARPEPVETVALLPDAPPAAFTWRGVRRRVRCADGPERVFGEWWKADAELARSRDYYQVEDDAGERFWLYRDGDGEDPATGTQRWFIAGIFA